MSAASTKAASKRGMRWSNVPLIGVIRAGWIAHENGTREQVRGTKVLFRGPAGDSSHSGVRQESSESCTRLRNRNGRSLGLDFGMTAFFALVPEPKLRPAA